MGRCLRLGWVAALFLLLTACGPIEISLEAKRLPNIAAVPGAERVSLDVVAQDARADARTPSAHIVGRLRHSNERIITSNDVADLTRSGVEQVLKDQGFVVAAGGLVIIAELQDFYFDSSSGTTSTVAFTLRVRDLSGRTLYAHHYEGKYEGDMVMSLGTGAKAKRELEAALADALRQVSVDTALRQALLAPRPPTPTAAPSAKGKT
jgi:hypothetical protein